MENKEFHIGQGNLANHLTWLQPLRDKFNELKPRIEEKLACFAECFEDVYYEDWFNGIPYFIIKIKGEPVDQLEDFGTFCFALCDEDIKLESELPIYGESPDMIEEIGIRLFDLEKVLKEEVTPILAELNGLWDKLYSEQE